MSDGHYKKISMDSQRTKKPTPNNCRNERIKGATVNDLQANMKRMHKKGAVHRLMYAITMLIQPFGSNDSKTLFEILRPVCFIAGWHSPEAIRPIRNHENTEKTPDVYVTLLNHKESTMVRGLYCKMIHDTDYAGDILYDIGFCLNMRVFPKALALNVREFHNEMEYRMNYNSRMLGKKRRDTLRVLHFICLATKKKEIDDADIDDFASMFPQEVFTKNKKIKRDRKRCFFRRIINRKEANYIRARQRSLGILTDRNQREKIDELVTEASSGHIITTITTLKGYNNLTAALAWDTLSR